MDMNKSPLSVRSNLYTHENKKTLVTVIEGAEIYSTTPKEVIFTVDVSSSMANDHKLESVKSCLIEVEKMIRERSLPVQLEVITFSSVSEHIWGETISTLEPFKQVISNISVDTMTNLELGVKKAFMLVREKRKGGNTSPITVICITDGETNDGQTSQIYFSDMYKRFGDNTKVITIGIGDLFSHLLLSGSDMMIHAKTVEDIPRAISSALSELISLSASNVKICTNNKTNTIGFICQHQEYIHVVEYDSLDDCSVEVTYTSPYNNQTLKCTPDIHKISTPIPDKYLHIYYREITARSLSLIASPQMTPSKQREETLKLSKWSNDLTHISQPYKSDILRSLLQWEDGMITESIKYLFTCLYLSAKNQRSYGNKSHSNVDINSYLCGSNNFNIQI